MPEKLIEVRKLLDGNAQLVDLMGNSSFTSVAEESDGTLHVRLPEIWTSDGALSRSEFFFFQFLFFPLPPSLFMLFLPLISVLLMIHV